jgi:uncharacterized protein (TIGR02246 family)
MNVKARRILMVLAVCLLGSLAAWRMLVQDRPLQAQQLQQQAARAEPPGNDGGTDRKADREAIRRALAAFLQALQSGDAKAVASHWTADGEYIDDDGTTIRGRAALEKAYAQLFARGPKPQAEAEDQSLRFVSRDTAVQEGFFKVRRGKGEEKKSTRFSILYVREDGKWLMAGLREWPGQGTSLRDLEWLIGTWASGGDGAQVHAVYEWDLNKSFIKGQFTIKDKGQTVSGIQIIGTDPATGQLRSWTFESEGDFAQAVWERDGDTWVIEAEGIEGDGSTMSATNLVKRLNDDTFTWQSTARTLDDAELPDLPPIKVTRVKGK